MKKKILLLLSIIATLNILAQEYKYTFMLTGASFSVKENGWFELGCQAFNAKPLNKAVSGQAILQTAMGMYNGTFYTKAELETIDAFIIAHVHNQPVSKTEWIKEDYTQYTYEAISTNYAIAFDYVIKKYRDDCYKLKDDPSSSYYGTENGKPACIVFTTHWHDSRTVYNAAIRELSERWGYPLVKWDEKIGFTKDVLIDGEQPSLKYSQDTETINGVVYGWHPKRGEGQYIQQKKASIFIEEMENLLGKIPVTATVKAKNNIIVNDDEAYVSFVFTGVAPWDLTYEVNSQQVEVKGIEQNPLLVKVDVQRGVPTIIKPVSVKNASSEGTVSGEAAITYADGSISPFFDTYAHNANQSTDYKTADKLELKTSTDNYSRQAFLSFDLEELTDADSMMTLRLFFSDLIYSITNPPVESHTIEVAGNNKTYTSINWSNKPADFTYITETTVEASEKGSFISWNVTEWIKEQMDADAKKVTFRLKVVNGGTGLFNFPSIEASANKPALLTVKKTLTSVKEGSEKNMAIYPNPVTDCLYFSNPDLIKSVTISDVSGKTSTFRNVVGNIDVSNLNKGCYIIKVTDEQDNIYVKKIVKN